jgi:hypothetical protein
MYTASKNVYRDRIDFAHPPAGRISTRGRGDMRPAARIHEDESDRGRSMSGGHEPLTEGY